MFVQTVNSELNGRSGAAPCGWRAGTRGRSSKAGTEHRANGSRAWRDAAGLTAAERRVVEDEARLAAVSRVLMLGGAVGAVLERLVTLGARTIGTPMAAVSFVDRDRQVFLSAVGLMDPWRTTRQMPLRYSFCKHAVGAGCALVVRDARRHPLVRRNPSVSELGVRAYLGVPVGTPAGHLLGTFNVVDVQARDWSARDIDAVRELAALAALEIEQQLMAAAAREAVAQAECRLESGLRARDEFLAMTVHDLRNYLNVISLGISLVDEAEAMPPEQRKRDVQRLQSSADQMDRLIRDLLDLAKMENAGVAVRPAAHHVDALVGECTALLRPLAERRSLALDVEIEDGAYEVLADRDAVCRVFANLIGNAVKFTPEHGRVTVRAALEGEVVRFAVSDTGRGIAEAELPHVFERFWQSSGHRVPGAGLGLAIAKEIVEAHGGRIWVESRRGAGTTFYFTMPAARRAAGAAARDVRERPE
jgi:signal transduction histidine kinase